MEGVRRPAAPAAVLALLLCVFLPCCSAALAASLPAAAAAAKAPHKHSGLTQAECPGACEYRCSRTQYKKACLTFCNKCCTKCRCVPPGTYGHKDACPCYNNWKTKEGGPKCP